MHRHCFVDVVLPSKGRLLVRFAFLRQSVIRRPVVYAWHPAFSEVALSRLDTPSLSRGQRTVIYIIGRRVRHEHAAADPVSPSSILLLASSVEGCAAQAHAFLVILEALLSLL